MVVTSYNGTRIRTTSGTLQSIAKNGLVGIGISIGNDPSTDDGMGMDVDPDEAFRFALAILRDYSLVKFGSG